MKHKTILILAALLPLASIAHDKADIKLGGSLDTQYGYRNQGAFFKKTYSAGSISSKKAKSSALVNKTKLTVQANFKNDKNFKYGAYAKLNADTSVNAVTNTDNIGASVYGYAEFAKYGRVEAGGGNSASITLGVSGTSIANAAGGADGDAKKWIAKYADFPGATSGNDKVDKHFLNSSGLPVDYDYDVYLSKITYLSPKFYGLKFGISYIFDTSINGTVATTHSSSFDANRDYRKIYTPSLQYETKIQDVKYVASITSQFGRTKTGSSSYFEHNLKAYDIGFNASYKAVTLGGSYGDWGRTAITQSKDPARKYGASYYTLGLAYQYSQFGASISTLRSKRANSYAGYVVPAMQDVGFNKFTMLSYGLDYKLAPGLMPYAEFSYFNANQHGDVRKNKGQIALFGMKLNF